ncbi:peptidoglycan-binding domain-containing protein [Buchananella felis]|uniref:peptidoglycan-binding domain-containing protein n=1 Tax=Buchananella felis TaxID=3231492 RepID=UPI003528319F
MRRSSVLVVAASLLAGLAVSVPAQAGEVGVVSSTATIAPASYGPCNGASWVWKWYGRKSLPSTWNDNGQTTCWLERDYKYRIGTVALQRGLNKNGQNVLVDGYYGDDTEKAVKSIQAAKSLERDGIYGPATRDVMWW